MRARVLRWLMFPALGAVALLVGQAIGLSIPLPPIVSYAISFSCLCGLVLGTAVRCPAWPRRDLPLAIAIAVCAAICIALVGLFGSVAPANAALVLAALLVIGSLVGNVVGTAIEHPGQLLFVVIVSSAADAASVLHPSGPSAAIVQSEAALSLLALPFAFLGTDATPPMLGVGDVVFASLYVACARRWSFSQNRTLSALASGFLVTICVVIGAQVPVPALPFLGIAMLVAHPEARRPPAKDRARGFAVLGLLAVALGVLWWRSR